MNVRLLLMAATILFFSIGIRSFPTLTRDSDTRDRRFSALSITTNDAYHYAASLRLATAGKIHGNGAIPSVAPLSPGGGIVMVGYFLRKLTGIEIERLTYHLPIVLSGLLGVVILLLGHTLGLSMVGFFAGLLAVSTKVYFLRTRVGYFDTDIFALLTPVFFTYLLFRSIHTRSQIWPNAAAAFIIIQDIFYINNSLITVAIVFAYVAYVLTIRRDDQHHIRSILLILTALLIGTAPISMTVGLVLVAALILVLQTFPPRRFGIQYRLLLFASVAVPAIIIVYQRWNTISNYVIPHSTVDSSRPASFSYTSFFSTVDELETVSLTQFADLISMSPWFVGAALIGLVALMRRKPEMILLTPLLLIGFAATFAGARFTLYAVPPLSLGAAYLIARLASIMGAGRLSNMAMWALALPLIYSNAAYALAFRIEPVVNREEALVLERLGAISKPDATIIAWWDYGYAIHYYSGRATIAAGHPSELDLYILSSILSDTSSQTTFNLSKAAVFAGSNAIEQRMKANHSQNKMFFDGIDSIYKDLEGRRDIYIYLPFRMLNIFPKIYDIGNRNIIRGRRGTPMLYIASTHQRDDHMWILDGDINVNMRTGKITQAGTTVAISKYIEIGYSGSKPQPTFIQFNNESPLNLIYLKEHNKIMILHDNALESFFIQAFFFENYDATLFDDVVRNKYALVLRING